MRRSIVLLGLLLLSGCSTWHHVDPGGGPEAIQQERYVHAAPAGWTYQKIGDSVLISRDGPGIQHVLARFIEWDEPIAGDPEGQEFAESMLPTDAADQLIAARRRELGVEAIEVTRLDPADVATRDGFRAEYTYRVLSGVSFRGLAYGAMDEDGVYLMRFEAPMIHFFERDLATFERVVASARPVSAEERKRAKKQSRSMF